MSDEQIFEDSAKMALDFAKNATVDKTERRADLAGYQTRSMGDGPINDGRSYSAGAASGPADVLSRESQENRKVIATRRKIIEAGELDMSDLFGVDLQTNDMEARENALALMKMQKVASHMINNGARQVVNNAYMNPNEASSLMEQEAYQPKQTQSGWRVAKINRKLKSGKQIPVFMAEDSLTGMRVSKQYRLVAIAEKVVAVMNATQNPDDTRIKMLEGAYEQHVYLMRSLYSAKQQNDTKKIQITEARLQEINSRLGIA